MTPIDPFSVIPLYLETYYKTQQLGVATGFVVGQVGKEFLITNWHVVTCRNPYTKKPTNSWEIQPNKLKVWFHSLKLGSWVLNEIPVIDEKGNRLWLEHPSGHEIDVIALPLQNMTKVKQYPVDMTLADFDLMVYPSDSVSIIGFPQGLTSGGKFPIWKTGHIASDIDLDWNGLPAFLIDATTKSGMSGSPVIAKRVCIYQTSKTNRIGNAVRFLGIYSGREIGDGGIEIGYVWKPKAINEILTAGI